MKIVNHDNQMSKGRGLQYTFGWAREWKRRETDASGSDANTINRICASIISAVEKTEVIPIGHRKLENSEGTIETT